MPAQARYPRVMWGLSHDADKRERAHILIKTAAGRIWAAPCGGGAWALPREVRQAEFAAGARRQCANCQRIEAHITTLAKEYERAQAAMRG